MYQIYQPKNSSIFVKSARLLLGFFFKKILQLPEINRVRKVSLFRVCMTQNVTTSSTFLESIDTRSKPLPTQTFSLKLSCNDVCILKVAKLSVLLLIEQYSFIIRKACIFSPSFLSRFFCQCIASWPEAMQIHC